MKTMLVFGLLLFLWCYHCQSQDSAMVYYHIGIKAVSDTSDANAIRALNISIAFRPTDSAYYEKGRIELYNPHKSLEDFNQAINLNPKMADAYYGRGLSRWHLGDTIGAITDCKMAIKLNPDSPYAYILLGNLQDAMGNKESALQDFTKAINAKPITYAYVYRGQLFFNLGNYSAALDDFDNCIKLDSSMGDIYMQRAGCKFALKDIKGCCVDLHKAKVLGISEAQSMIDKVCK